MVVVPLEHSLLLASFLFCIGLFGVMVRRNIIFILMSLELMLNAAALAFVAAGAHWGQADGQIMFLLILTLAAAEVAVALVLVLHCYKQHHSVDIDQLSDMRG
ncbi:MAG: NADH-quinone oxidoreductase subunit NuoK [Spongiibacteraceae bacterium]|nr:NADH-quinone oxidoreductase subunit NuoK [Spongiibacteraceae bacterium]